MTKLYIYIHIEITPFINRKQLLIKTFTVCQPLPGAGRCLCAWQLETLHDHEFWDSSQECWQNPAPVGKSCTNERIHVIQLCYNMQYSHRNRVHKLCSTVTTEVNITSFTEQYSTFALMSSHRNNNIVSLVDESHILYPMFHTMPSGRRFLKVIFYTCCYLPV